MYIELIIGIVVCTEIIKKAFKTDRFIHSKWLALAVAILGAVSKWIFNAADPFALLSSIGIAMMAYDYIFAVGKDLFINKKNPLT